MLSPIVRLMMVNLAGKGTKRRISQNVNEARENILLVGFPLE